MKNILHEVTRHFAHWITLVGIIAVGLWGLLAFSYDPVFQSAVAVSAGASFVAWGVIHHFLHEDLRPRAVVEYLLTAIFGVAVLLSLIWR